MDEATTRKSSKGMCEPWSLDTRRRQFARAVSTLVSAALLALTTGGSVPSDQTGDLRIIGSRAMSQTVDDWTRLFKRQYPNVQVRTMLLGDGVAAGALASERADIAPLSRPLADQERSLISSAAQPVGIPVSSRVADPRSERWAYLYVARQTDAHSQVLALAFVRTALSPAGQARIAGGFAPLPDGQRNASLNRLARLKQAPLPRP